MKNVDMRKIDGYEFENFCYDIMKDECMSIKKMPYSNDFGKDLIAVMGNKKYVIECKHYLCGTVGRPVIQKLHSAMIHENTNFGILMTTGKVSENAINYIKDMEKKNYFIKILDREILAEKALRKGINIFFESENIPIKYIESKSIEKIKNTIILNIESKIRTSKGIPKEMIQFSDYNKNSFDFFMIDFMIDSLHKTNAMSHRISKTGNYIYNQHLEIIEMKKYNKLFNHNKKNEKIESLNNFGVISDRVKEKSIDKIIREYTETINYYGKNNSRYTKECIPRKKDININGISVLRLEKHDIKFLLKEQNQKIEGYFTEKEEILEKDIKLHSELSKQEIKKGALCEECFKIIGDINTGESYKCDCCKKIICFEHAYYDNKFIVLREFKCIECNLPTSKLVSSKTNFKIKLLKIRLRLTMMILIGISLGIYSLIFFINN